MFPQEAGQNHRCHINSRVKRKTHKYGIKVPTSVVEHALEIDRKNRDTFWRDDLANEMYNVGVFFRILEDGESLPVGYSRASAATSLLM